MTTTSPDAKAVVRALEALTTQLRRATDALTTPVVVDLDGTRTTPDDGPRTVAELMRCTCDYIAEPWISMDHRPGCPVRPAADEDEQRTTRRQSLRILINRVNHGVTLTTDEAQLLARHVATEICDANTAEEQRRRAEAMEHAIESTAADALAHRGCHRKLMAQCQRAEQAEAARDEEERLRLALAAERDRWQERTKEAQAAIERVRRECAAMERDMHGAEDDGMRTAIVRVLAALDGTEQPTTEA